MISDDGKADTTLKVTAPFLQCFDDTEELLFTRSVIVLSRAEFGREVCNWAAPLSEDCATAGDGSIRDELARLSRVGVGQGRGSDQLFLEHSEMPLVQEVGAVRDMF